MFNFFFILLNFSKSVPIHVIGDWNDSYPLDEAKIFFNYVDSSYLNCLNNLPHNSTINQILLSCENIEKDLYGLLNLSLSYRIFHPKASIQNPISSRKPFLNGFLISEQSHTNYKNRDKLGQKFLSSIFSANNKENNRFNLLKKYIQHFNENINEIEETPINQTLLDEFNTSLHSSSRDLLISINQRNSDLHLYNMILSLIEEYKITKVINKFKSFSQETSTKNSYFSDSRYEIPPIYVDLPHPFSGAVVKDVFHNQFCAKLPDKINPNANGISIFNTRKNLVVVSCFIKLFDKNAKSLLKNALDDLKLPRLLTISIFPIFNAKNETERKAAFAFQILNSE